MVRGLDLFLALFNNLAIFIALVTVYSFLDSRLRDRKWYQRQLVTGLSFAFFAIVCMYAKIPVYAGVIVDQRNAIVALSAAFGGPLSALVSAALTAGYRAYLGGSGAAAGVIGVGLAVIAGLLVRGLPWKFLSVRRAAASAALASIIILPGFLFVEDLATGWNLVKVMSMPFGSAIFLGVFLGGLLLQRQEEANEVERRFRKSERRYRELVESTQDLITHTDPEGVLTFVNHVSRQILGDLPRECVGRSAFEYLHPDDRERTTNWFNDCIARNVTQSQVENRQVNSRTGQVHTVLWSSTFHYDDAGRFLGVGSIARDVTRHRLAEDSLRESEALYRSLFENVPDGILIADTGSVYLDVNPAMCEMLGYARDEILGMHASGIVMPDELLNVEPALEEIKARSRHFREWNFRRKDGTDFAAEVSVTSMPNGNLLAMVRDITKRRELEVQLRQAQKMESIGKLAGGIAHDFNNILVPIIGYVDLALMDTNESDKTFEDLLEIRKAAEKAAGLTRQILAFSRKQVLEMRVVNLNGIVSEFERMINRLIGEDIVLQTTLDPDLDLVLADKGQIEQVLLNLAVNARDAMRSGGTLTLETANVQAGADCLDRDAEEKQTVSCVMLKVSDTGCGMDEETGQRIFEPFYTTKALGEGTGLGLATVFGIVKQHRGNIVVSSEVGAGSTFTIYLPSTDRELSEEVTAADEPTTLEGTETVLLAEDDGMVRRLVRETLAALGYRVLEASNAEECLRLAGATDGPIHLLLTDVVMPEMNGRELFEQLRKILPEIKVLFMSGYTDNVVMHLGVLDRGIDLLQKPFSIQDLKRKLRNALDRS